jgi:hypothetical protein
VSVANKILSYLNSSVCHSPGKEQLHEQQTGKFELLELAVLEGEFSRNLCKGRNRRSVWLNHHKH